MKLQRQFPSINFEEPKNNFIFLLEKRKLAKSKMVQKSDDSIDNSDLDLKASIESVTIDSEKNNR